MKKCWESRKEWKWGGFQRENQNMIVGECVKTEIQAKKWLLELGTREQTWYNVIQDSDGGHAL